MCYISLFLESSVLYRRGRKRSRKEFDLEDLDDLENRPQKRSKIMEPQITLDSDGFNFGKKSYVLFNVVCFVMT